LWVSSHPRFARHEWNGAWVNTLFRNEGERLSSELITEAIAITQAIWGTPLPLGMITFIDKTKVKGKKHFGYCYRKAGFTEAGYNKINRLLALQLLPEAMPTPLFIDGVQLKMAV